MNRLLCFILVFVLFSSCYVFKAYRFRKFALDDLNKIGAVPVQNANRPFTFAYDTAHNERLKTYLDSNLRNSLSYAFLVIRNDSILYERYFGEVTPTSMLPSFSAAKSVTSTLFAIAMNEGKIKRLSDPITDYLPELRKQDERWSTVTLQHVLDMRSGVKNNESYTNPFSDVLKLGFARNVSKHALKSELETTPGTFDYKSVNTQLLALVVEKVTGKKLQDYAAEKLWGPLQLEFPGSWNSDKKETVRAFCCINLAARDYAKFGRLFLHGGVWDGRQLVPASWINRTTSADTMAAYEGYKNQWWARAQRKDFSDSLQAMQWMSTLGNKGRVSVRQLAGGKKSYRVSYYDGSFYAAGLLGQYVWVEPKKNLVIVRLGHNWSHPSTYATQFIQRLAASL